MLNREEIKPIALAVIQFCYSSRQLIPIFQTVAVAELGIKGQLPPLFLYLFYMIPIDCKLQIFPYTSIL